MLKLVADRRCMVTALLSGQRWLMLNKSCCNCQVQRIHSENRLWIEYIIMPHPVIGGGRKGGEMRERKMYLIRC